MKQNMVKLAVGIDSVEALYRRQKTRLFTYGGVRATKAWTRRKPREFEEIVNGGSIYWVIKNHILVRQHIIGFELEPDTDVEAWEIILSPDLMQTIAVPRKAFQGWRYLSGDQAPPDRHAYIHGAKDKGGSPLVEAELATLGLL